MISIADITVSFKADHFKADCLTLKANDRMPSP
jgi:hypothetical protein